MAKKKLSVQQPPSHAAELKRIKRIQGQLDGVRRMIEEQRYCPDILMQTRAVAAAVKSLEAEILKGHLENCVKSAMRSNKPAEAQQKIDEVLKLFKKL